MTDGNDDGSVSSRSSSSGGDGGVGGSSSNAVTSSSSYLVRVHAQVMMRDDSRGGWLPRGGGGLSHVAVLKRVVHHHHHRHNNTPPPPSLQQQHHHNHHPHNHQSQLSSSSSQSQISHLDGPSKEYLIYGKKISDQSVVLNCSIRKDFEYNKVMPTFHHWRAGEHKFGLTFQTAADARAFDKGVRQAVKELMDELRGPSYIAPPPPPPLPPPSTISPALSPYAPLHYSHTDCSPYLATRPIAGGYSPPEGDVFVAVNLPINTEASPYSVAVATDSQSHSPVPPSVPSSAATTPGGLYYQQPSTSPTHLQRIYYQHKPTRPPPALPPPNPPGGLVVEKMSDENILSSLVADKFDRDGDLSDRSGGCEHYPYVQFASERPVFEPKPPNHEYCYPVMEVKKPVVDTSPRERRDSIASIKKANQQRQQQEEHLAIATTMSTAPGMAYNVNKKNSRNSGSVKSRLRSMVMQGSDSKQSGNSKRGGPLSNLSGVGLRQQCRHCHDSFYPDNNPRGSCEYAPDLIRSAIDGITCIGCAQCMLYHCVSDDEEDFTSDPCTCSASCCYCCGSRCCGDRDRGGGGDNEMTGLGDPSRSSGALDDDGRGCGRRWFGLTLLSLIVPCLCCYLPLRGCYSAFVSCGVCGARHDAMAGGGRHAEAGGKYSGKHADGKLGSRTGRYSGATAGRLGGRAGGRFDGIGGS